MSCAVLIYIYLGGAEGLALPVAVAELARLAGGGCLGPSQNIINLLGLTD
ncbi:hypothetical protein Syun_000901 [Stephania yunnanensis]|uniref:Uncharacterized protein n=1 Tax=Stephania yunnanensis TaxID=152371 RepID=A0AAP0QAC7_9MAGN